MTEGKKVDLLDYFVLLVKWKKLFAKVAIGLMAFSYLGIYIFIEEEYEAIAVIVPSENQQLGGITSIMKNLGNLPIAGLKGTSASAEMDLYMTIINSKTLQEDIINKFDLLNEFGLTSMEKAIKRLESNIKTKVTDENAFQVTVRGSTPQKAVEITNYILKRLNETIIQLNIAKSKNNRIFLEQRYNEVKANLRSAEDSLQLYQQSSGMLEVKEQTKLIVEAYTQIETQLLTKQLELSILENTYSKESPLVDNMRIQVQEYQKKLAEMKKDNNKDNIILALNSLPQKAKSYVRHYRDVEIFSTILEFLVPLYEQAKFEEQKDVPVLQIIDKPRLPEKKAYPPRTLFAAIITFGGILITYFYVLLQENSEWKQNEKIVFIKQNILQWKR